MVGPVGAIEDAMVTVEVGIVGGAGGAESRRDGALLGSKDRPHEEALGVAKDCGREK